MDLHQVLGQPGHVREVLPGPQHEEDAGQNQRATLLRRDSVVPAGFVRACPAFWCEHHATRVSIDQRPDEKHRRGADTQIPQHAPAAGGDGYGRENGGGQLAHRYPGGHQSGDQRQRTLAGIGIGKCRTADGEHREGNAFQAARRQNQPSGFRLHQRQRVAENHQRQGPEDQRRGPVTLDGTTERDGKHQAEEGVNGHEAAGEDSVVAVIRQQHG